MPHLLTPNERRERLLSLLVGRYLEECYRNREQWDLAHQARDYAQDKEIDELLTEAFQHKWSNK